jgi:glycosyltransferase involved in cell wall biosynthesis
MENKLRLIVVEPNASGGLIHYAYQLCTALADQGAHVTLVTGSQYELAHLPHNFEVNNMLDLWTLFDPQDVQGREAHGLRRLWGRVFWTFRRGLRALRLVRAWMRLNQYLIQQKPDIIQFSKINFPFEALFLSQLRRQGLLLTQICHEFELRESRGFMASVAVRLYRSVYSHFSALFFHANENRERFLTLFPYIPRERTHIIPHGNSSWLLRFNGGGAATAELRRRYGLAAEEKAVLFFGLLAPSKGIEDLVEAFALAKRSGVAKLIIAGYPTKQFELQQLRSRISALGLQERVFLDTRYIPLEELGGLMDLATVVVYPYHSSTQSGALQVAYTFGRPVIATQVGGLPEAVEDGRNGFLVPAGSPERLAEKISLLLDDPALAGQMGAYARHLSETRFSWQTVAAQILEVERMLISAGRSSRVG